MCSAQPRQKQDTCSWSLRFSPVNGCRQECLSERLRQASYELVEAGRIQQLVGLQKASRWLTCSDLWRWQGPKEAVSEGRDLRAEVGRGSGQPSLQEESSRFNPAPTLGSIGPKMGAPHLTGGFSMPRETQRK